jgi:hypothetical protein
MGEGIIYDLRRAPHRPSWKQRAGQPTSTPLSRGCRTGTRRSSASGATASREGRSSASPSRASCSRTRAC